MFWFIFGKRILSSIFGFLLWIPRRRQLTFVKVIVFLLLRFEHVGLEGVSIWGRETACLRMFW